MERGLDESAALWAVVLGSVGSAAGRLLMPLLSDKIGRRPTDLILFGVSLGLSAVFLFSPGMGRRGGVCGADILLLGAGGGAARPLHRSVRPAPRRGELWLSGAGTERGKPFVSRASLISGDSSQGRHILAIAGAAAGFACIWAVTPVRREPHEKTELRSCAPAQEKRKWQKDCEKFVRNDLQIGPTSSIIKLCVVVPGEALKRERRSPVNARRQGREAPAV